MRYWLIIYGLLVLVCAESEDNDEDTCARIRCSGRGYECIDGKCYCADGYVPINSQTRCVRCPGLGERCFGPCCDRNGNGTLQCWEGVCQSCYDELGQWVCKETLEQVLLISSTQVVMGAALVLGIIGTFILLYKLCATKSLRPLGAGSNSDSRLSVGSLQLYIEERLRDAPPRYSRAPAVDSTIYPAISYLNAGFIHDSTVPPPPYDPETKSEENQGTTVHI